MVFSELKIVAKTNRYHINNVTYLEYLDTARKEFYAYCVSLGVEAVLGHISADYKKEIHNGDVIKIRSAIEKIGNTSLVLRQTIVTDDEELVVSAKVVIILLDRKTRQKVTVPDKIRELASKESVIN